MPAIADILRARNIWIALGLFGFFGLLAWSIDFRAVSILLRACIMCVSIAILVAYGRDGLRAMAQPRMDAEYQLLLGINVSWLATALQSAVVIWWRLGPFGAEPIASAPMLGTLVNATVFMQFLGAVLHITSPGSFRDYIPQFRWIVLGIAVGIGVTLAWLVLAISRVP